MEGGEDPLEGLKSGDINARYSPRQRKNKREKDDITRVVTEMEFICVLRNA